MNWTQILLDAGIPDSPGYQETAHAKCGNKPKEKPEPKKAKPRPSKGKPKATQRRERLSLF